MEETLKERLETILQRHIYLEKMMQLPQIAADFQRYKMYAKEQATLQELLICYIEYKSLEKTMRSYASMHIKTQN